MGDDLSQQHDLMNRLKEATALRRNAEWIWRDAIAAAHAAGVSLRTIGEVAGVSDEEIQAVLRDVEAERGPSSLLETD
jgi:lambda repressor-like predicted transcriptional regulator